VLLALAYVAFVAFDFIQTPVARVLALVVGAVVGAVVAIIYLALTRVVPEFSMAVFRMSDNIQATKRQPSI
jgi:cell division septal protein FtsQ